MRLLPRRATLPTCTASQRRSTITFSEVNQALEDLAAAGAYESNVWLDERALRPFNARPRPGERAATVRVNVYARFYNGSQLRGRLPSDAHLKGPHSLVSRKPFARAMAHDLERIADIHRFSSKWWAPRFALEALKVSVVPYETEFVVPMLPVVSVINVDQVDNAAALRKTVWSGGYARPVRDEHAATLLRAHMEQHGLTVPVYFTAPQLEVMGLHAAAGAEPCDHAPAVDAPQPLIHAGSVPGAMALLEERNWGPTQRPLSLADGLALRGADEAAARAHNVPPEHNYWARPEMLTAVGLRPPERADSVFRGRQLFNAQQLDRPLPDVLRLVGSATMARGAGAYADDETFA